MIVCMFHKNFYFPTFFVRTPSQCCHRDAFWTITRWKTERETHSAWWGFHPRVKRLDYFRNINFQRCFNLIKWFNFCWQLWKRWPILTFITFILENNFKINHCTAEMSDDGEEKEEDKDNVEVQHAEIDKGRKWNKLIINLNLGLNNNNNNDRLLPCRWCPWTHKFD